MRYTKEIFEILSRGGFISQNSISPQRMHLYDAIEDDFQQYQEYFEGIGFLLEGGNGYYYFSRSESKVERKSNILEKFSSDIELKEKARHLYTDLKTNEEKMDKLIGDLDRQGFVELENELDSTYKVTAAFHYIEELIDCLTIIDTETEQA